MHNSFGCSTETCCQEKKHCNCERKNARHHRGCDSSCASHGDYFTELVTPGIRIKWPIAPIIEVSWLASGPRCAPFVGVIDFDRRQFDCQLARRNLLFVHFLFPLTVVVPFTDAERINEPRLARHLSWFSAILHQLTLGSLRKEESQDCSLLFAYKNRSHICLYPACIGIACGMFLLLSFGVSMRYEEHNYLFVVRIVLISDRPALNWWACLLQRFSQAQWYPASTTGKATDESKEGYHLPHGL